MPSPLLAIISDEISQDLTCAIHLAKRHRFDGLEIRSVWGRSPLGLSRRDCRRISESILSVGLRVAAFASPAFKEPLPRNQRQKVKARVVFEKSLERATWLGAPLMRIFSFRREGMPDPVRAAEAVIASSDLIRHTDVTIAVETGTTTNTPAARHMSLFLALIGLPIGVVWDPGNCVFSGYDQAPFPEGYRNIRDRIRHVHVKDPGPVAAYVPLGEGTLPWLQILETVRSDRFSGFVSLETHWRVGRELTAAQLEKPQGYAFSEGAFAASELSMALLKRMLGTEGNEVAP